MIITVLEIAGFGKLKNLKVPLNKGLNVITGENESGKTTIANFVISMLYGITEEAREQYLPYEDEGTFGGSLTAEKDGKTFTVTRSFYKDKETLSVISDGRESDDPEGFMKALTEAMPEEDYRATAFISQDALRSDGLKWGDSPEKAEKAAHAAAVRAQIEKAEKSLAEEKKTLLSGVGTGTEDKKNQLEKDTAENEKRLRELAELLPEKETLLREKRDSLVKEISEAENANRKTEETLKSRVLENKKQLKEQLDLDDSGNTRTGTAPLIMMMLGAVLLVMIWADVWYDKFDFSDSRVFYTALIGSAVSVVLILIGLILNRGRRKAKAQIAEAEKETGLRISETADAEKAYQNYLDHRDSVDVKVENREAREKEVRDLQEEYESLKKESEEREISLPALKKELGETEDKLAEEKEILYKVSAVEEADKAFKNILEKEPVYAALSERSGKILRQFSGNDDAVTIDDTARAYLIRDGKNISLSRLSTAATEELLLSVRLSELQEKDPEGVYTAVLDDVFTNFDEDHLKAASDLMRSLKCQVILLSCREADREVLSLS